MGISIQRRRGTTSNHSSFTGKPGEMTVDTTKWTGVIHDGSTVGGIPLAKEVHTHSDATESVAGFMSAADKTKLDTITGGTVGYQTIQANGTPQTARAALNLSANFSVTDDGAGNRTSVDLSDSGVTQGTYTKVTVNAKGRVTAATLLSAGDIPNITSSKISDLATTVQAYHVSDFASANADVNLNSHKLINVSDPTSGTDAANKQYVDAAATGLTFKAACRVASAGSNVNISAPGTTIDGVTLNTNDRVLLKDQSDATQNGIYSYNGASSTMVRTVDANSGSLLKSGTFVLITEGNLSADVGYVLSTTGTITIGTTNLTFVAFSSGGGSVTAGNGINVTGSTVSVRTASSGRIAVGSGGVDLATTGVTAGTYTSVTVDVYGRITTATATAFQALNANLTALAGISTNGFAVRTGSGAFAARTLQPGTGIGIVNGDGVSGNVSISVNNDTTIQQVNVAKNGTTTAARSTINFIEGSGVSFTLADNPGSNRLDLTITSSGGSGGAPTTSQYVTLANDSGLTNERVLTAGSGILITDGGANGNVTISFTTDLGTVP
jgi:hypothetical protein